MNDRERQYSSAGPLFRDIPLLELTRFLGLGRFLSKTVITWFIETLQFFTASETPAGENRSRMREAMTGESKAVGGSTRSSANAQLKLSTQLLIVYS